MDLCEVESEDDGFGLTIVDVGEFRHHVFYLGRQITAKSTQEVNAILDNPAAVIIVSGGYREICWLADDLQQVGAKTKIILPAD
jgi:hypothetical protein